MAGGERDVFRFTIGEEDDLVAPFGLATAAMRDIGQKTGLYGLMNKRGFTNAQLDACIANPQAMKQILAMTDEAWNKVKIGGTPGFTVNGTRVEGSTWSILQAALPPAAR